MEKKYEICILKFTYPDDNHWGLKTRYSIKIEALVDGKTICQVEQTLHRNRQCILGHTYSIRYMQERKKVDDLLTQMVWKARDKLAEKLLKDGWEPMVYSQAVNPYTFRRLIEE